MPRLAVKIILKIAISFYIKKPTNRNLWAFIIFNKRNYRTTAIFAASAKFNKGSG
ncbi:hypothetical protein GCM10023206_14480 [Acinetobacter puyangensis]